MADIDDLLGGLGDGPRLPLAPADAVLARGDRLRRRQTQLVAAAGALLVLTAGAGFYAATSGSQDRDALVPAAPSMTPTTPPAPTPSASSSPSPSVTATASATSPASTSPTRRPSSSASQAPTARPVAAGDRVTLEGVGPLRLGMTYAQVEAATGGKVTVEVLGEAGPCAFLDLAPAPAGLNLVGVDGRLALITVTDGARPTASGVRIGDAESKVRQVYGASLKDEPTDYYGTSIPFLVVRPAGSEVELAISVSQGEVTRYSVGTVGLGRGPEGPCI